MTAPSIPSGHIAVCARVGRLGPTPQLVDSPRWEHPNVRWFTDAMRLHAGEGFRFTCSWENPDDHAVRFGVTSEDEMCFVTGYFYPDDDAATVTGPGCQPQGAGLQCFVPKAP